VLVGELVAHIHCNCVQQRPYISVMPSVSCCSHAAVTHGLCRVGYAPAGVCVGVLADSTGRYIAISAGMHSAVMNNFRNCMDKWDCRCSP